MHMNFLQLLPHGHWIVLDILDMDTLLLITCLEEKTSCNITQIEELLKTILFLFSWRIRVDEIGAFGFFGDDAIAFTSAEESGDEANP